MPRRIPFYKMHGAGNDFIMIDGTSGPPPRLTGLAIARMCARRLGIGADGLILLLPPPAEDLDFRMVYYNADGSEAAMCGNGARCAVALAHRLGLARRRTRFVSATGRHQGTVHGDGDIEVTLPGWRELELGLQLDGSPWPALHFCNTGVPHLVIPVADPAALAELDLERWGPRLRSHPRFQPAGTNVNWVARSHDASEYLYRTYERGVEAETLACGTGASAAAVVLCKLEQASSPVALRTRSRDLLTVWVDEQAESLRLRGPAHLSFQGEVALDE